MEIETCLSQTVCEQETSFLSITFCLDREVSLLFPWQVGIRSDQRFGLATGDEFWRKFKDMGKSRIWDKIVDVLTRKLEMSKSQYDWDVTRAAIRWWAYYGIYKSTPKLKGINK